MFSPGYGSLQKEQALGENRGKAPKQSLGRSPALLAAQHKLQILREQHGVRCEAKLRRTWIPSSNTHGRSPSSSTNINQPARKVPDHLGWGSVRLTAALKVAGACTSAAHQAKIKDGESFGYAQDRPDGNQSSISVPQPETSDTSTSLSTSFKSLELDTPRRYRQVKLYPDLALGMLKQKQEAAGRIWLLLQFIDEKGRGWIHLDEARRRLAQKGSPLYVCGRRQLRKLLARGEGLFWQRDDDRIWLRSTVKVAVGLSVHRLTGHPIALPINVLLQGIGDVRAHFYASFHSGRSQQTSRAGQSKPRTGGSLVREASGFSSPISRATLQEICQVSRRTQRRYEKRASVRQQANFAIGQATGCCVAPNREDKARFGIQEQAWLRGQAVFRFIDHKARLGQKGESYTAWQLPNNYIGPHKRQLKGRQKRMNRELADLFTKGMTGNGNELVHGVPPGGGRLFYDQGYSAAASYNRSPDSDLYWRSRLRQPDRYQIWHVLPSKGTG